jgi:hypothetical protein
MDIAKNVRVMLTWWYRAEASRSPEEGIAGCVCPRPKSNERVVVSERISGRVGDLGACRRGSVSPDLDESQMWWG